MRKALTLGAILLTAAVTLYACGIIPNADTSVVTITIGDTPQQAQLSAEAATPWLRLKHALARVQLIPEANAYIPSVVQVIIVTVTAADIPTPIVGVHTVGLEDTSASIRLEVPNGTGRTFQVDGYRGIDSLVYYSGTATADLSGGDVDLPIAMNFTGPAILVDASNLQAADTPGCGTTATPCSTVTYALATRTSGTDVVLVSAGTYTPTLAAQAPTLQLKPATALICAGADFGTVIDFGSTFVTTVIWGADGASVDNCRIVAGPGGKGIDDRVDGTTVSAKGTRINGSRIELLNDLSASPMIGADLYSDSPVVETTVTATGAYPWNQVGIQVSSVKPSIISSAVMGLQTGISISSGAGDAQVKGSILDGNSTGISIETAARPTISGSSFINNGTGIFITAGTAEIASNTMTGNSTGISIAGGSPRILQNEITGNNWVGIEAAGLSGDPEITSNRIYCNTAYNLYTYGTTTLRATGNAWENAPPLVSDNLSGCAPGVDICYDYMGPVPLYSPYNAAAVPPGTCSHMLPAKPR